jgi:ABC-type branched-subunit amino acid transport system permease subunit
VQVSYAKMISIAIAAVSVVGLYAFLQRTRLGIAMRAVVDDPRLLGLTGTRPVRIRAVAWVISSCFAALSGILLAPTLGLDAILLTLLVVQAFGATAIGRFSNLPLTYVGGLVIGVIASIATKYLAGKQVLGGLPASAPFLVLVVILLVIPTRHLPGSRIATRGLATSRRTRLAPRVQAVIVAAGGLALVAVPHAVGSKLPVWIGGLTMLIVFASLSLLVWTSGQISLCHTAFAALGATTLSHLTVDHGVPWGVALLLAGVFTVPLGALVAIPAIRLSGLYLALTTFGFAVLVQNVGYDSPLMFGTRRIANASRPRLGFIDGGNDIHFYYIVLGIAVAACVALLIVNRSRLGRLLRALSESPTMLVTNGLNTNISRLIVFCVSAFFAGLAGGLMITQASAVNSGTFPPLQSLIWLAVLAICGTRLIGSSVAAAALFSLVPSYISGFTTEQQTLAFGAAAVTAAIVVTNIGRISAFVRRLASESEQQRRESPVRAREEIVVPL